MYILIQDTKVQLFVQICKFFMLLLVLFKFILYSTAVFVDKFWLNEIYFVPLHVDYAD